MENRVPLTTNKVLKRIEELPTGSNLDLTNSGIVSAVSIQSETFYGNLVGIASTALTLPNAANILSGTVDRARLSGLYDINISGTADYLTSAENILSGTISSERLAGPYNIDVDYSKKSGISTNADKVLITEVSENKDYYIHFNDTTSGYDNVNISSTKLVFNPSSGSLGVNTTTPLTNLQVNFYGVESKTGTFLASAGKTVIDSFSVTTSNFKMAEYTLLIQNSTNLQTEKILIMQNGTTSQYQEYSIMYEPTPIISVSSAITAGSCTLEVTPISGIAGNITYKFYRQTIL